MEKPYFKEFPPASPEITEEFQRLVQSGLKHGDAPVDTFDSIITGVCLIQNNDFIDAEYRFKADDMVYTRETLKDIKRLMRGGHP